MVEQEIRLLKQAGHSVKSLVPKRQLSGPLEAAREALSAVWSFDAVNQLQALVANEKPDIVHCHNLFPTLSPAVLRAAATAGAPAVVTLHNYRLLCLPATFLRRGRVCELCLGKQPWRGVVHRCYRGSLGGSLVLATSLGIHRALGSFDQVRLYLAASEFVRTKYVEAGFPADRIIVKSNFVPDSHQRSGAGDYFLYAGRLAPEKDIQTLVDATSRAGARLIVAGAGPDGKALRLAASREVVFEGLVPAERVASLLTSARALVLPSLSYEGVPVSILEAYAAGVPVIANEVGGLPELIADGNTGLLVPPRDPDALASALIRLSDDAESERMGAEARRTWEAGYSPKQGLAALERAYAIALEGPEG